jgi:hypothetical protein
MKELTKEQKEYLIELIEDKIFMDEDVSVNSYSQVDKDYYSDHISKMKSIIKVLQD